MEHAFFKVHGVPFETGDVSQTLAAGIKGGEDHAAPFFCAVVKNELELREREGASGDGGGNGMGESSDVGNCVTRVCG